MSLVFGTDNFRDLGAVETYLEGPRMPHGGTMTLSCQDSLGTSSASPENGLGLTWEGLGP